MENPRFVLLVASVLSIGLACPVDRTRALCADPPGPERIASFELSDKGVEDPVEANWIGFSPDGKQVAAYCTTTTFPKFQRVESNRICLWNLNQKDKPPSQFKGGLANPTLHYGPPARFSPNGAYLLTANRGGIMAHPLNNPQKPSILLIRHGKAWDELKAPNSHCSLWLTAEGKTLTRLALSVSEDDEQELQIDTCQLGPPLKELRTETHKVSKATSLTISPDQTIVAWAESGQVNRAGNPQPRTIHLLHLEKDGKSRQLTTAKPGSDFSALAFSNDGRYLACGGRDGSLTIWDVHTDRELATLTGFRTRVTAVTFGPDNDTVAYASFDGGGKPNVKLYSMKAGRVRQSWAATPNGVTCLTFDRMGRSLAVAGGRSAHIYTIDKPHP